MQEILSADIVSRNTVWSKTLFLFVAGAHTDSCIDVASHYNLCVGADHCMQGYYKKIQAYLAYII
jgi:hypothetical protein